MLLSKQDGVRVRARTSKDTQETVEEWGSKMGSILLQSPAPCFPPQVTLAGHGEAGEGRGRGIFWHKLGQTAA